MQKKFCARINTFHRLLGYPWTMMNNLDRLTESQLFSWMIDILHTSGYDMCIIEMFIQISLDIKHRKVYYLL